LNVKKNAHASITTTSAQKVYASRNLNAPPAFVQQQIFVQSNAWLEFAPEFLILHHKSKLQQISQIHIENQAGFLFIEAFAPGRTAYGESLSYENFSNKTELHLGDDLVFVDSVSLYQSSPSMRILQQTAPTPYTVTIILVSAMLKNSNDEFLKKISVLENSSLLSHGLSKIHENVLLFRAVCSNSLTMKKVISNFRAQTYKLIGLPFPNWRKN
ncbi:MAG: urease accessory protein UreD, partial [Chthoniobacterales bacterium]|nr:urease accessory protein UreD [Chthoniobacterales bacterium]